ncbi:MAG: sugar transferase [Acidimicrobiia bacterium]|nr:sugar transferase [Acidimicrobiia bacterium]
MAKRLFDIAIASTGLIVWAVPFAVIALAVKLSSPGPVRFRQQRVGRGAGCSGSTSSGRCAASQAGPRSRRPGTGVSPRSGRSCAA